MRQIEELKKLVVSYIQTRDEIMSAKGRTDQWKKEQFDALKQAHAASARAIATAMWGKPSVGALEGGALWQELDNRTNALRSARDKADSLDPARVQLAALRLPSVLYSMADPGQVAEWYDNQASSYEARALQFRSDLVRERFGNTPAAFGLVVNLQQAYDAEMQSPAVVAAESELDAHLESMAEAYEVCQHAAGMFESYSALGAGGGGVGEVLKGVLHPSAATWKKAPPSVIIRGMDNDTWLDVPATEASESTEA